MIHLCLFKSVMHLIKFQNRLLFRGSLKTEGKETKHLIIKCKSFGSCIRNKSNVKILEWDKCEEMKKQHKSAYSKRGSMCFQLGPLAVICLEALWGPACVLITSNVALISLSVELCLYLIGRLAPERLICDDDDVCTIKCFK